MAERDRTHGNYTWAYVLLSSHREESEIQFLFALAVLQYYYCNVPLSRYSSNFLLSGW